MDELYLSATSRADDLAFVALVDVASVFGEANRDDWRLIGGQMVQLHAYRFKLGADLYRETRDVDIGVPPVVVKELGLVDRLRTLGYEKTAGERLERRVPELAIPTDVDTPAASVDLLVPAYTSHARSNRAVGDEVVTIETRGLALALTRPPIIVSLTCRWRDGREANADVALPDEFAALAIKSFAWEDRRARRDAVDVWRCLEIGNAADARIGATPHRDLAQCARIIRSMFADRDGEPMRAIAAEQSLSADATAVRFTRISALIDRVLTPESE